MAKKEEWVAMYVDSTSCAREEMAPTTDSMTAKAGAVLACSEDERVGKPCKL
jgi:hypothetical protein